MRSRARRALAGAALVVTPTIVVPVWLLAGGSRSGAAGGRPRPSARRTVLVAAGLLAWTAGDLVRADLAALATSLWAALPVVVAALHAGRVWRGLGRDRWWRRGAAVGLAAGAAVAWLEVLVEPWGSASPGRAALWFHHPNTLAAAAVAAAALLVADGGGPHGAGTRRAPVSTTAARSWPVAPTLAWILAGAVVLASGSRTGLAGWALLGLVLAGDAVARRGPRSLLVPAAWMAAAAIAVVAGTGWADRFFPNLGPETASGANLIAASEDLGVGPWRNLGVEVQETWSSRWLARTPGAFVVRKVAPAWWSRSQQVVPLPADAALTLTFEVRADAPVEPGVHGLVEGGGELTVVRRAGGWMLRTGGPLGAAQLSSFPVAGGWERVEVSFRHRAPETGALAFGPLGDARADVTGGAAQFRRLMLVEGPAGDYLPTAFSSVDARASLGTWEDRLGYLRVAWSGFVERPWVGHRPDAFASAAAEAVGHPASHAHNALAVVAYERGLFGLLALAGALLAFWRSPAPRRVRGVWTLTLAALGALDATWFASGAVALAAWHAAGHPETAVESPT